MQVSIFSAAPSSQIARSDPMVDAAMPAATSDKPAIDKRVDFSRITPRQLLDYVNEQQRTGALSLLEGGSLIDQVNSAQWDEAPDAPFDLRASLNGTKDFFMDIGSAHAAWYAGLIARIDVLEVQSVRLDVFA